MEPVYRLKLLLRTTDINLNANFQHIVASIVPILAPHKDMKQLWNANMFRDSCRHSGEFGSERCHEVWRKKQHSSIHVFSQPQIAISTTLQLLVMVLSTRRSERNHPGPGIVIRYLHLNMHQKSGLLLYANDY